MRKVLIRAIPSRTVERELARWAVKKHEENRDFDCGNDVFRMGGMAGVANAKGNHAIPKAGEARGHPVGHLCKPCRKQ